ncbi:Peptide-N4-(N-acetyl-beta-glucosaminyl)asparagine amidase A [Ananas comosus]|uniref:Peptide-N4-(N-acetyl-beta-glucosaminyl)asparagine amidase A n=1 Tax=Ananas comosus TaxID=4615 RepID=A0A199ULT7_ANACO|nr:Peptide-N4-(N-acetyl-beta-glucosaminyl)asparagine amidase A [Ananas comosus]
MISLFLFVLLRCCVLSSSSSSHSPPPPPPRLLRPRPSGGPSSPQEYLDPTQPPLPLASGATPSCSLLLLSHSFASTYGQPPVSTLYSSPPCASKSAWATAVLSFSAASQGDQYDRIAAVWLGGAELLRTSTPEPTPAGIFWTVQKDVTRYAALLRDDDGLLLSVMLENIVNPALTGVFHVNVSLSFYPADADADDAKPTMFDEPADAVVPISAENSTADRGFWFRIANGTENNARKTLVAGIPPNTYRAALEVFASAHGDDEFWYSNPPDSYIEKNNLTTRRGNAAFREIVVSVDGQFAGSVVPFPVIFAGGINPLFWVPVVGLGAFDLPSYTLDLTPFLGLLLDRNKSHEIGLAVADAIEFWLVDANLHLWLDRNSDSVAAALTTYLAPNISISRRYSSHSLNGTFKIEAGRKSRFAGWVNSSAGNLTTEVAQKLKFKSSVVFANDGQLKTVNMKAKQKTDVVLHAENAKAALFRSSVKTKYPFSMCRRTRSPIGRMRGVDGCQDHDVIAGSAGTRQTYQYRDDGGGVYRRTVAVRDGVILSDATTKSYGFAATS